MRVPVAAALIASILVVRPVPAADDETAAVVAKQKQTAEATWKTMQLPPAAMSEGANFIVYGTIPESRLKALVGTLEKQCATAVKGLQFDKDSRPWTGKLAVYVFADRSQFRSFVRQIEKRSPDDGEQASRITSGETPHIAVGPGQGKDAATPEVQASYEVAAAVLAARAKATPVPDWLVQGFARATAAQATNTPAGVRKRGARQLVGRLKPSEAWNEMLSIEQRLPLATSVADYLFYGKGVTRPADFLMAFRPDDEKPMKTTADALEAVKLTPEQFEVGFLKWLRGNN
jgi:hypothetical protein